MAEAMADAPAAVTLGFEDDGWTAAALWLSGHAPVWGGVGSPERCSDLLDVLGLPPLSGVHARAELAADLVWRRTGVPGHAPLPRVDGPLVTILVCTYNRGPLLAQALTSALAQSWPCEVVVVDDGSTDSTPQVLAGFPEVRVLRQVPNQGKPAALARGVAAARGDAILVLDDDDLLLPGSVQVLAKALFDDPALVAVWADTVVFDGETGSPKFVRAATRVPPPMVPLAVLQQVPAMPGATLVRTAAWRAAGPLDPTLIRGQDMDLFLALSRVGPIATLPLPTFLHRVHDGLRGSAAGQWRKQDRAAHRARFNTFVKPVFVRRWAEAAPATRQEGHAWALGLHERDADAEARRELDRWPGPWSAAEAWVRAQVGVATEATIGPDTLVVVDDGDDGALELTLHLHARPFTALHVDLEVPRDPLGDVKLYWPGTYAARTRFAALSQRPGPWRMALTSAPGWTPPALVDPSLLPDLSAGEALLAVAAVLGWPMPMRTRPGLATYGGPIATLAWRTRRALDAGDGPGAMAAAHTLLTAQPGWRGAWLLAEEAFRALGEAEGAAACHAQAEARRAA